MPASQLVSAQHGIIAWWKNARGDTARLVALIAILVRRYMEPTGRGAARNIGQPIPTLGAQATTTPSEGYWVSVRRLGSRRPRPTMCRDDESLARCGPRNRQGQFPA